MSFSPKKAWDGVKILKQGLCAHHKLPQNMRFKKEDGSFSKNDTEHIELLQPHFHNVFNRNPPINRDIFQKVRQFEIMQELDTPLNFAEFQIAVKALTWYKAPGLNRVVPNAIKALDPDNLTILYKFVWDYMETETDYEDWKVSHLVPLPKKVI